MSAQGEEQCVRNESKTLQCNFSARAYERRHERSPRAMLSNQWDQRGVRESLALHGKE